MPRASVRINRAPDGLGNTYSYGKWVWEQGQTRGEVEKRARIAKGTLLFARFGLTNVRQKSGMRSPALFEMLAGFGEAQLAVHGKADVRGILVFLAVVFPPADRAKHQGAGCIKCLAPAARASIAHSCCWAHTKMDGKRQGEITASTCPPSLSVCNGSCDFSLAPLES